MHSSAEMPWKTAPPALARDRPKIILFCHSENDRSFDGKHGCRRSSGDSFRASVCQSATDCEQKNKCGKTHYQSMYVRNLIVLFFASKFIKNPTINSRGPRDLRRHNNGAD